MEPTPAKKSQEEVFAECEKAIDDAIRAALAVYPALSDRIEQHCRDKVRALQETPRARRAGY